MKTKLFHAATALLLLTAAPLSAQTWTGAGADRNWSNPANWNPGVPGQGGNVFIGSNDFAPVDLDIDAMVGSITMGYGIVFDNDRSGPGTRNLFVTGTTTIQLVNGQYRGGFDATSGANYRLGTLTNFSNGTLTGYYGAYDADGTTSNLPTMIQFSGANVITNNADVLLDGANAAIVDQETGQNAFRNLAANNGDFYVGSSLQMTFPGNFANTGNLYVYDELEKATNNLTINGTFANNVEGAVYVNEGGNLLVTGDFNNDTTDFNGGIFIDGDARFPEVPASMAIGGNLRNGPGGFILVRGRTNAARLSVAGNLTNAGFIALEGIGSLDVTGTVLVEGDGEIEIDSPPTSIETFRMTAERIDLAAGTRFGARGTVFADLVDRGVFAPGHSPGLLTINGDVTFTDTAELQFEIAGTTAGTQYDRLDQITRATDTGVVLGGRLTVTILNGFQVNGSHSFTIINSDRPITGAFKNVPSGGRISTADGSGNFLVTYAGQNTVTLSAFQPGPLALQATGAVSRKMHGALGPFDIPLPLTGAPGVECRSSGGNHSIVFTFSNDVVSGNAAVTAGTASVVGSPLFNGNTMTVNVTGVADVQQIAVTLSGITDSFAQVLPSAVVTMNLLAGDTNGNKIVNATDIGQTKASSGAPLTSANFRQDVTPNGSITASDIGLVKSRSGATVP